MAWLQHDRYEVEFLAETNRLGAVVEAFDPQTSVLPRLLIAGNQRPGHDELLPDDAGGLIDGLGAQRNNLKDAG